MTPSSDICGILRGRGGDNILLEPGIEGEMDSGTAALRNFLGIGVPATRGNPGTEDGPDSWRGNLEEPEGETDPCSDTRGMVVCRLEAGTAPSELGERVADMGIWSLRRRAPKSQRPTLVSESVVRSKSVLVWADALALWEYVTSGVDAFDRELENSPETVRHSDCMLHSDVEGKAVPKVEAGSGIWAVVSPALGGRSASCRLSPLLLLREAFELWALIVPERARAAVLGATFSSPQALPLTGARLSRPSCSRSALSEACLGSPAHFGGETRR